MNAIHQLQPQKYTALIQKNDGVGRWDTFLLLVFLIPDIKLFLLPILQNLFFDCLLNCKFKLLRMQLDLIGIMLLNLFIIIPKYNY